MSPTVCCEAKYKAGDTAKLYSQIMIHITKLYLYTTFSTVWYGTVQYSTVRYSTVRYSTVQYSTIRYTIIFRCIGEMYLMNEQMLPYV